MTDAERIAALQAEVEATQDAGAQMVAVTIVGMGATPEQMAQLAEEFQAIADGRHRSRISAKIARKVAERLRARA